ncbi:uncharacterized protein PgNI_01877 [Pyricularia grisea]|uniref:Uncharacterized protein n=1 Tax=Pyricularia grisea TaxID=148305 RepID=A0A6P8BI76_PYRGI|nr:uncharacterized protein PgNI_01877 [Pyricularia grisea]TLD16420.1 hypothetical protein PgNI_01877 [Pyricularia grisea]
MRKEGQFRRPEQTKRLWQQTARLGNPSNISFASMLSHVSGTEIPSHSTPDDATLDIGPLTIAQDLQEAELLWLKGGNGGWGIEGLKSRRDPIVVIGLLLTFFPFAPSICMQCKFVGPSSPRRQGWPDR